MRAEIDQQLQTSFLDQIDAILTVSAKNEAPVLSWQEFAKGREHLLRVVTSNTIIEREFGKQNERDGVFQGNGFYAIECSGNNGKSKTYVRSYQAAEQVSLWHDGHEIPLKQGEFFRAPANRVINPHNRS